MNFVNLQKIINAELRNTEGLDTWTNNFIRYQIMLVYISYWAPHLFSTN